MRSKLATVVSIVVLLVLVTSALTACQPAAEPTKAAEPEEAGITGGPLEVGVLWEEGNTWYDMVTQIGASLEEDYPGTEVTYTFNNTQARPALNTRWQTGDPPDVDLLFDGTNPSSYDWVTGGYLLDLTPYMNEKRADGTTWKEDFLPLFANAMEYEGKIYGAPELVYVIVMHYNAKMFDEWGLTPPATWEEFLDTCETIKGKGVAPIVLTGMVDYYVGMWSDYLFQRYAGTDKVMEYLFGDTDMKIAGDQDFLNAAQELMKLSDRGYLIDGWQGIDFTTSQIYYFQSKGAMILMGSWLMAEMKESIPEGYELAVAPFPTVGGGKGDQSAMFGRTFCWSVAAKSENPELAVEYLKRFSSKEWATKRTEQLGSMSVNVGVPAPGGIGGAAEVLAAAGEAEFIFYHYGTTSAKFGLQSAWYDPVVQMLAGKFTPEEALAKIDSNMAAVRDQRETAE